MISICYQANGQKSDYMQFRDSLTTLSCGKADSLTVIKTLAKLEAFDTNRVSENIQQYYRDLGWCYYLLSLTRNDTALIRSASKCYDKALFHDPNYVVVLWDKSFFSYYFYNDCDMGKYYLDRYKKATPRKYWNKRQMKMITQKCKNQRK